MFGLGSSSQLGIGIAISLHDKFSQTATKVNASLLAMRKNATAAVDSAVKDYRNQAAAFAAIAGGAALGMINIAKQGAEFDHTINTMTILGGGKLGKTNKQLNAMAQDMSKNFALKPLEIGEAMLTNVRQGVTSGLDEITKYQVAVAAATKETLSGDTGVAANLLNIMNAMDIGQDHFKDVANTVTSVANATQASVYSIGESMQYAAFTAHQFNLDLPTTVALVGKLAQVGIRGTSAGTGLNNLLTQMAKSLGPFQTKRQLAAWQMLGVNPAQITDMANKGNIQGVISAVSQGAKNLTPIEKGSIIPQAFNMRGTRALEGLFDSEHGNKAIADILKEAKDAIKSDLVMTQVKQIQNDLYSEMIFFGNAIERFKITFMTSLEPLLRFLTRVATKVVDFIGVIVSSPIGKVFAGIAFIGAGVLAMLFAFRAAVFTATIALRGFTTSSSVGGFGGLLRSSLGSAGIAGMGMLGGKIGPANAAGMRRVLAGQVVSVGSKVYKGGQFLPAGILGAQAIASTGWLGTIGGLIGRSIPILGGILLAVTAIEAITGQSLTEQEKQLDRTQSTDPLIQEYYKNMDEAYYGKSNGAAGAYAYGQKNAIKPGSMGQFSQNIQINIDGKTAMDQRIQQNLEETLNQSNQVVHLKAP